MILTRAQREALARVYRRTIDQDEACDSIAHRAAYRALRRQAGWGWDCVMVPFAGMWLGIEKDGYTHS